MRRSDWLVGTLIAVAVLAALGTVVFIPFLLHPSLSNADLSGVADAQERITLQQAQAKLQDDARSTILQGFAGLILVLGAIATWRQVQISRHGQITERITRAVDQLAHKSVDVRLGGLYALERVARDSYQDRAAITSILTAFVRTHVPLRAGTAKDHEHTMPAVDDDLPWMQLRAEDAQTALYILAYRPRHSDESPPYLSFTDLRKARMGRGWWCDLICQHANLAGARLQEAHLERAILNGSDLREAHLVEARLGDAKLIGAHLEGANLQDADLRGTDLTGACLEGAELRGVQTDNRTKWPEGFDPTSLRGLRSTK